MAVDVEAKILIDRTPEEVAAVMFNPKQDKLWIRNISGSFPMESGLYKKGAKIERVGNFLGKHYSAKLLVTKFEENKMVQIYSDEPFEMNITYDLKKADDGTNASITVTSIAEILFDTPIAILSKKLLENLEGDLKRLKKHLEQE
ncbi:MAG: SRPBCC family protein [Acidobacteria bacterium]|nr:SRPBCC family protein [Acidobacteriota bacterium]